jgi:ABC-type sugar transport system ATPase subunit
MQGNGTTVQDTFQDQQPVLVVKGVSKRFPGVQALDGVRFNLFRGEVHALLGENGAGKSTLVKILSGVYPPDNGEVIIGGAPVADFSPQHVQKLGVATIYQELTLVPDMSVMQNIFLGREPGYPGIPSMIDFQAMEQQTREILDRLGVHIHPRMPVRRLSIGHRQMVEIAKAISMDARIIIMDEPTSSLAKQEVDELFTLIRQLQKQGVGIIYISHRLDEVARVGDRCTVFRDGKWIATRRVGEVTTNELIRLMVGRDLQDMFPKVPAPLGDEVLRVENLTVPGKLMDVSFSLRRGEILGVAGLIGAGRSELVRSVFGAETVSKGRVLLRGRAVNIKSPRSAIRHRIGLIPEERRRQGLITTMSVRHNIGIAALHSMTRAGLLSFSMLDRLAKKYVDMLRIKTPSIYVSVASLSGGNQQKVVIARSICSQSDILIFDEPTRGIDVGAKVEVYQLMNQLVHEGKAIIMVSSELPEILGMSDRILVMRQGRISGQFSRAEVTQEDIMACAIPETEPMELVGEGSVPRE